MRHVMSLGIGIPAWAPELGGRTHSEQPRPVVYGDVAVVGAGAWGTALAVALRQAGRQVMLWARDPALAARIGAERRNARYLPEVALDAEIRVTADAAELAGAKLVLLVVPSQGLQAIALQIASVLASEVPVVVCAKGIEAGTGRLMHEVAGAALPSHPIAILSGPTFAGEVARGLPAVVSIAAEGALSEPGSLGARLVASIGSGSLRPYLSDDLTGVAVGGAVKNVIAIACGIAAGRDLGANAEAALVTRGMAEIMRLGRALGARPETLMGPAGLGDLVLTCTNTQSRNRSFGVAVGRAGSVAAALAQGSGAAVVEGVGNAPIVCALAARHRVEVPISTAVARILTEGAAVEDAIRALLDRPFRAEP